MVSLKKWLLKRPAISIQRLEVDAGLPPTTLSKYLSGERGLPEKYHNQVLGASRLYGYKGETI